MSADKVAPATAEALRLLRVSRTRGVIEVRPSPGEPRGRRMPVEEMEDGRLQIGRLGQDAQGAAWRQAAEILWAAS